MSLYRFSLPLIVGLLVIGILPASPPCSSAGCENQCAPVEHVTCPAPKIVVEMSQPEVVFRQAPCAPVHHHHHRKCGLLRRLFHHCHQCCQPSPVLMAPAMQMVPAAPMMAAPQIQYQAMPIQQTMSMAPISFAPAVSAAPQVSLAPQVSFAPQPMTYSAPVAGLSFAPATSQALRMPISFAPAQVPQSPKMDAQTAKFMKAFMSALKDQEQQKTPKEAKSPTMTEDCCEELKRRVEQLEKQVGIHDSAIRDIVTILERLKPGN